MSSSIPDELVVAIVCEKMGWTYEQYLEQPVWLIKTLLIKWQEEGKYYDKEMKKARNRVK